MSPQNASTAIEGDILSDAVLAANEMCSMNFARTEFDKLEKILLSIVIPAMGGYENKLASGIACHIEHIRIFSGNFCWEHRHLGASYGVVGQRPGIDDVEAGESK